MGRYGIAVRTKWQSGIGCGDRPAYARKGNHLTRRRQDAYGENKPDLSRKINHICRHCSLFHQNCFIPVQRCLASFPSCCVKILANPAGFAVAFLCIAKNLLRIQADNSAPELSIPLFPDCYVSWFIFNLNEAIVPHSGSVARPASTSFCRLMRMPSFA